MAAEVPHSSPRNAVAQWQRIEQLVRTWLDERQMLLTLLCSLQGIRGLSADTLSQPQRLQRFCELLMDYISAGYFEIYRELANEARVFGQADPRLVEHILQRLEASTDAALAFNAAFDDAQLSPGKLGRLPDHLTPLMTQLEERFALEDQLILSLHACTLERAPTPVLRHH